jgi:hypothetical protein
VHRPASASRKRSIDSSDNRTATIGGGKECDLSKESGDTSKAVGRELHEKLDFWLKDKVSKEVGPWLIGHGMRDVLPSIGFPKTSRPLPQKLSLPELVKQITGKDYPIHPSPFSAWTIFDLGL